ncbi:MAG: hypothetical protein ABI877_13215 [Gemmatimonadaceae bacterium]
MLAPPEEKNRCWRLPVRRQLNFHLENFHLDSLPSLAAEESFIRTLRMRNVPEEWWGCGSSSTSAK